MEAKYEKLLNCIEATDCRDRSFDLCRQFFVTNWKKPDMHHEIALNLYAYLASWGMLRNSFLKQMNYLALVPVVEELCRIEGGEYVNEYLLDWEPQTANEEENEKAFDKITDLIERIRSRYESKEYYKDYDPVNPIKMSRENVTDTMVSKILLGTFGCVPAYDDCLKAALSKYGICQNLNAVSLDGIIKKLIIGNDDINCLRQYEPFSKDIYTTMRIVDFILWHEGSTILQNHTKGNNRTK